MTTTRPVDSTQEQTREQSAAEVIRRAVSDLNAAVAKAADLGLRVEVQTFDLRNVTSPFAVPVVSVAVTKSI
jgi:hypothetical protein